MGGELGVSAAALQVTFSLLVVLQTFCSPLQGWLVDRFGPRLLISTGRASWVLASFAGSLGMVYLSYGVLGGIGTGIVNVGVVGQMVR
jgi:MFS transporter, OFA family, oxalate/formate antiporter